MKKTKKRSLKEWVIDKISMIQKFIFEFCKFWNVNSFFLKESLQSWQYISLEIDFIKGQ